MNTQKENTSGKGLHYYGALHEMDGLINAAMPTIPSAMVHATRKNKKFRRKLKQFHRMFERLSLAGNEPGSVSRRRGNLGTAEIGGVA